jgi:uncharacterized protein YhaN
MKLLELRLIAFGPFTDAVIDFSAGPGLHIVYGPNEAGKSSALRAIRSLLFGIADRTADSFLHSNASLRIGGRLVKSDGTRIEFVRRKGRAKTLRSADDGGALDDDALAPFLGGVDQALFERMFAIGHDDLVSGGQEIVSGGGSVGQALFAAGAGLIRLQTVQQALLRQCDALFKPSASKPRINTTLTTLNEVKKHLKDALLPAKTWKIHHQSLGEAQARLAVVKEKLAALQQQSGKLERIGKALPLMGAKTAVEERLLTRRGVPDLPADFEARRRSAENEVHIGQNDLNRLNAALAALQARQQAVVVPLDLIRHAQMIEELQPETGQYRKAQKDRPALEARMRTLKKQAAVKLSEIGPAALERIGQGLRLAPSVVGAMHDMGKAYERLWTRLETARERCGKLETLRAALQQHRAGLAEPADVRWVKTALQAAQEAGPLENQLAELGAANESREKALLAAAKRLPLWRGSLQDLDELPCPSRESIDRFQTHWDASAKKMEKLVDERHAVEQETAAIAADLDAVERSHDVPTETDLENSRRLRGNGWGLIKETLAGKHPCPDRINAFAGQFHGAADLPGAFEISVAQADQIADRLRREADQVSRKCLLEAAMRRCQTNQQAVEAALAAAQAGQDRIEQQWKQLWLPAGIQPLLPQEMRAWLDQVQSLREKGADIRRDKAGADLLAARIGAFKSQLGQALADAGSAAAAGPLTRMIAAAKVWVQSNEALAAQVQSVEKELAGCRQEQADNARIIAALEAELARWKDRWAAVVADIGLDADASPAAAQVVVEAIREAARLIDEAEVLDKRIEGIDRDAAVFEKAVWDLVHALAPDLQAESAEKAALLLNARLTEARESLARQKNLNKQIDDAQKERPGIEMRLTAARAAIERLCHEAGCRDPGQLEEIQNQFKIKQKALLEKQALEDRLRELAAGMPLEAFIAELAATDPDWIAPETQRLAQGIQELEAQREQLYQTIADENAALKQMDGSARAAELAEQSERLLAGLEADVENYARLKIASVLLARTIERYRQKHQGPLIQKASALFARMTVGSFSAVRADYDDNGRPVLVGVRSATGMPVTVEGMSDGTADQLYLALRLASLEQYLEKKSEPLPFVVDDILLRFDDQRALATLEVLGQLSFKTQVIFFTHHRRIAELARGGIDASLATHHGLADHGA